MSEPVIYNWDRIVHKNARTNDRADVGNIIQVTGETIRIMQGGRQYEVPKSKVEGFDGSEVYLSIPYREMMNYSVA